MADFLMPSLGSDMEEGTLVEWLVAPGDTVHRGDIVAVVDTEKSDIEVEVFEDGVVAELLVEVGTTVPVGTPLARIEPTVAAATATVPPLQAPEARPGPETPVPVEVPQRDAGGRPRASPYARRLAAERGLDLASISGSGPGGAVVAADVDGVPTATPVAAPYGLDGGMRAAIARTMTRSKREIPHYYLQTTVDLGPALAWLRERNERSPVTERALPAALLLSAVARAAAEHPALNGWWQDGGHRPSSQVHLGVAIALRGGGLVAPGIADADRLSLSELMAALRDLTTRARAGRVRQGEWTGQTITVTNLGDLGVEAVFGVIHPPQLAMVGFGTVHDRVLAIDGEPAVRPVVVASLAADHRASDGVEGSAFLTRVSDLLQRPAELDRSSPTRTTEGDRP